MVANGKVVGIHYRLTNTKGQELERTDKGAPFQYVHGSGTILPSLEESLRGLKGGDKVKVTLPPGDAYGEIDRDLKKTMSRSVFPKGSPIKTGDVFKVTQPDGSVTVYEVERTEGDLVYLNANHPLAGQALQFFVEIVSVRDATEQEVASGQVAE